MGSVPTTRPAAEKRSPKPALQFREATKQFRTRRFAGPTSHAEQLQQLRMVHLTDMHVGRVTPMKFQYAAVELTNRAKPDLVAITGDFVCHSQRYLDALIDVVRRIDAPVVCTLGNHDHWSGADEVRWALKQAGAEILDNVTTVVELRRQRLQIVGLDDAYTSHADAGRALRGYRSDLPTIALSHIAEEADRLWAHGIPLVLSGHTHAGQVTFAKLHELTIGKLAGHKYVHGLYGDRMSDAAVYVGAGVGASVMPLRIGERGQREVTIFELGAEIGSFDEHHAEQPSHPGRKPSKSQREKRARQVLEKRKKRERRSGRGNGGGSRR
ncbi:MAG: metallophosphoesterase [Polyangiaceae bacterium]